MPIFDEILDYDVFFEKKLTPLLKQLKIECRIADGWGITILISGILGFASFLGVQTDYIKEYGGLLIAFFIFLGIFSVYQYSQYNDRFTDDFKTTLIKEIIAHIEPSIIYKPDLFISKTEYVESSLFRYKYSYYTGSDYMEGNYKGVSFHCSQIHTQSDDGRTSDIDQPTIFKGLFFVAKISPRFTACTYIWDKNAVQLASSIMDEEYRLLPMPYVNDVEINDITFKNRFRVCGTDPYEANEILTTISKDKILELIHQMQRPLNISFVLGNCFVGIPFQEDIFGPSEYVPGDKDDTKRYFNAVYLIPQIINQLELSKLQ